MENDKNIVDKEDNNEPPKLNYRGVKAMPFIIGNETFEKLGTIGTSSNLAVYLTSVFNLNKVSAATIVNIFNGSTNLAPLAGAFLSDTYFGRYKTLGFACCSSLTGMFLIMLTAAIPQLHPPHCGSESCIGPTSWQLLFLLLGFMFLVVGAGGIRPCNLAFGADQFNPETESGKKGINSFFNWYYFTFTFAMMVSLTGIVYVQSKNWTIGFAIPTGLMFLSCALFFMGTRIYVRIRPEGSPVNGVIRVFVAASKKRSLKIPQNAQVSLFNHIIPNSINSRLPYTDQFRWIDKAAIRTPEDLVNPDGSAADPWRLCGLQQVEEVKCLMRVVPVWASSIIHYMPIVLQQTYAIFQAVQSDRSMGHFQVPAGSFGVFMFLALTIWIPIYDRIVVPSLRRVTGREGGITQLQRMGAGIVCSILSALVSGVVEVKRRDLALTSPLPGEASGGGAISSMSAFWLVPQLLLAGLAEAFNSVGQIEFYYKQFPENMRSIAGSFFFLGLACSNYLCTLLISVVHKTTAHNASGNWLSQDLNKGRLDYFYYMIAIMCTLNFGYFLVCSTWYRYKGTCADETTTLDLEMINGTKESTEKQAV